MSRCELIRYRLLCALLILPMLAQSQTPAAVKSFYLKALPFYLVLQNASFPIHHIRAQTLKSGSSTKPVSLEIYNLLIPATTVQKLAPTVNADNSQSVVLVPSDTLLITLSVLPNTEGVIEWKPISVDTISAGRLLPLSTVIKEGRRCLAANYKANSPQDCQQTSSRNLLPIAWREGHYWTPKSVIVSDPFRDGLPTRMQREWPQVPSPYVMMQCFLIRSYATRYLDRADYVTINVKSPTLSFDAPWRVVRTLLPPKVNYTYSLAMGLVPEGVFKGVFEFWSRPRVSSGVFEYKPGIGLISGSYDDYFYDLNPAMPRLHFDDIVLDGKIRLR